MTVERSAAMTMETTPVSDEWLLQQAPDGVVFANRDGIVERWNAAAERIFGFSAGEAVGSTLDFIIPEQFRAAHWAGFDRALAAGATKYVGQAMPTRALHADGHEFYVELSFSIVHGDDGAVVGALTHARDITERFTRDRETRRTIRELEAELATYRPPASAAAAGRRHAE